MAIGIKHRKRNISGWLAGFCLFLHICSELWIRWSFANSQSQNLGIYIVNRAQPVCYNHTYSVVIKGSASSPLHKTVVSAEQSHEVGQEEVVEYSVVVSSRRRESQDQLRGNRYWRRRITCHGLTDHPRLLPIPSYDTHTTCRGSGNEMKITHACLNTFLHECTFITRFDTSIQSGMTIVADSSKPLL